MIRTPYFYKLSKDGNRYELHFHTGEGSEVVELFDSCNTVAKAQLVANAAFKRGQLVALRKRLLYLETNNLHEIVELHNLIDSLTTTT